MYSYFSYFSFWTLQIGPQGGTGDQRRKKVLINWLALSHWSSIVSHNIGMKLTLTLVDTFADSFMTHFPYCKKFLPFSYHEEDTCMAESSLLWYLGIWQYLDLLSVTVPLASVTHRLCRDEADDNAAEWLVTASKARCVTDSWREIILLPECMSICCECG